MGYFRSHQGVCDTPLHLFDENVGKMVVDWWAAFAHFRAYAIRPYTCSLKTRVKRWWNLHLFAENAGETVVDGWPGKVPSVSVEAFPVLIARCSCSCP